MAETLGNEMTEQQRDMSDYIYCLAMRLTDAGAKDVDRVIKNLCLSSGVAYPPVQKPGELQAEPLQQRQRMQAA